MGVRVLWACVVLAASLLGGCGSDSDVPNLAGIWEGEWVGGLTRGRLLDLRATQKGGRLDFVFGITGDAFDGVVRATARLRDEEDGLRVRGIVDHPDGRIDFEGLVDGTERIAGTWNAGGPFAGTYEIRRVATR